MAEHPSLALVESLANLAGSTASLPREYRLIKVDVAAGVRTTEVDPGTLPAGWRDDLDQTRSIGDDWLASAVSVLLAVPSAPSPESTNYLLNPLHADAHKLKIDWCRWINYDRRLFGITERL